MYKAPPHSYRGLLLTHFLNALIVSTLAVHASEQPKFPVALFVVPLLLFAPYAGRLADRFSKCRVLQIAQFIEIPIVLAATHLQPLALFLLATQATFFSPARYGMLPEIVDEVRLPRANALLAFATCISIVFGIFLARSSHMGSTLLVSSIAGALASLLIPNPPSSRRQSPLPVSRPLSMRPSTAGISWLWFIVALLLATRQDPTTALLILASAAGIGSLAAAPLSGAHIELGLVPAASLLMGIATVALAFTHSYSWTVGWLAVIGFTGGLIFVPLNAYLQAKASAHEKGRILANNNFANMAAVVLAFCVLWLLQHQFHWSAGGIMLALGCAILAGTVYAVSALPDITVRFILLGVTKSLFRIRVEGRENIPLEGGALLVSNHISYADSVLVGYATNRIPRFLMWQPIFDARLFRPFFEILHAIPIALDSPKNTIRALRNARAELENGELVAIFPEGHISLTGELEPFERGFDRIVSGTGAPIIPMHLDGVYGHPLSRKGGEVFRSWEHLWRPVVTVRVGQPIYGPISAIELRQIVADLSRPAGSLGCRSFPSIFPESGR